MYDPFFNIELKCGTLQPKAMGKTNSEVSKGIA